MMITFPYFHVFNSCVSRRYLTLGLIMKRFIYQQVEKMYHSSGIVYNDHDQVEEFLLYCSHKTKLEITPY